VLRRIFEGDTSPAVPMCLAVCGLRAVAAPSAAGAGAAGAAAGGAAAGALPGADGGGPLSFELELTDGAGLNGKTRV
jgi:hypothetical protein